MRELILLPWIMDVLVTPRTENTEQTADDDLEARFLAALAAGAFGGRLAEVLAAAGQCPEAVVLAADEEHAGLRVGDENVAADKGCHVAGHRSRV